MVMGFADSMQMVSAIRIRLREGDNRYQAVRFAVQRRRAGLRAGARHGAAVVPGAAVLAIGADPHLRHGGRPRGVHLLHRRHPGAAAARRHALIRNEETLAKDRTPGRRG